ncbi:MAG TPA: helix-turn-helix domain-containing protein [Pirellulales bacterium]
MARKLIDQEEAARILGITAEQVSSLRDRKKLFPYRDGDQWKYKQEDIERYRDDMQAEKPEPPAEEDAPVWDSGDSVIGKDLETVETAGKDSDDIELSVGDEIDSILLSEVEMGKSSMEGASTIIGKPDEGPAEDLDLPPSTISKSAAPAKAAPPKAEDVISLDDDADLLAASAAAPGGSMVIKTESGLKLPRNPTEDSRNVLTASDTNVGKDAGSSGFSLVGDSSLAAFADVKLVPSAPDEKTGSDKIFGSDALQLSDDELKLMDPGTTGKGQAKPAEPAKKTSGSSIKLGDEELEVVLGSKSGSDVTQSPNDSGIQLISPSDSGLSLDQPLSLGSSARRLLDMPLDDLGITEELAAEAPVPGLKPDEDFLLTAMDETGEESSDSGSQVIALDTDDELSSGMFAGAAGGAGLLEEEPTTSAFGGLSPVLAPSSAFAPSAAMMGGAPTVAPAEAPYTAANITVLSICAVLLMLCGMMTFDLMRNMWGWNGPYSVNSSILDSIGKTVGWMEK